MTLKQRNSEIQLDQRETERAYEELQIQANEPAYRNVEDNYTVLVIRDWSGIRFDVLSEKQDPRIKTLPKQDDVSNICFYLRRSIILGRTKFGKVVITPFE
ncbi:hypothetical protein MAR_032421 [Mya arenaria]|uniref:Uncharacterized protein n=1 Tax=Mya arenaria TaxID=6604 RepID=A0ABY7F6K9_MYAAR|nr:hypothetical protein MAR_032421 [Mya arenaria]